MDRSSIAASDNDAVVDGDAARISRRRALQIGAAGGVGAAVWAGPLITRTGLTPAYAQACTAPVNTYTIGGDRNTACNCGSNPNKYASYKDLNAAGSLGGFPGTVTFRSGSCAGALVSDAGECPPTDGNAGACIQPTNPNLYCKLQVEVFLQSTGALINTVYSGIVQGSDWVGLPQVPCQGQGSIFVRVKVVCSEQQQCL